VPRLTHAFFDRPTLQVARALLGQRLVRLRDGERLAGLIVETEAYVGEADLACHARVGKTPRTAVMYTAPGHAYVYFTYGMHWLLNFVTEPAGFPAAVLVRALAPQTGLATMRVLRRGQPDAILTNGPAKLAQALAIDGALNGLDLCARGAPLWVEAAPPVPDSAVVLGPRIGLGSTPEPWLSQPWNFKLRLVPIREIRG
jgi:DNA-3-methyladenine glycosylase